MPQMSILVYALNTTMQKWFCAHLYCHYFTVTPNKLTRQNKADLLGPWAVYSNKTPTVISHMVQHRWLYELTYFTGYIVGVITAVLHSVGMKHRSLASASENACA
jgi:hypothetical protein